MAYTTVTQENFDDCLQKTKNATHVMFVHTHTRIIMITAKEIQKFEKAGYALIAKDKKDPGFRLQQGKKRVYVFSEQLTMQEVKR